MIPQDTADAAWKLLSSDKEIHEIYMNQIKTSFHVLLCPGDQSLTPFGFPQTLHHRIPACEAFTSKEKSKAVMKVRGNMPLSYLVISCSRYTADALCAATGVSNKSYRGFCYVCGFVCGANIFSAFILIPALLDAGVICS